MPHKAEEQHLRVESRTKYVPMVLMSFLLWLRFQDVKDLGGRGREGAEAARKLLGCKAGLDLAEMWGPGEP